MPQVIPWKNGDKLSAAHLNELWEIGKRIANIFGWNTNQGETDRRTGFNGLIRLGIVVDKGPHDEADFTDERYWVYEAYIFTNAPEDDGKTPILFGPLPDVEMLVNGDPVNISSIGCVHNVAEILDHSHTLRVGQAVIFFAVPDLRPADADGSPASGAVRLVMFAVGLPEVQYQYTVLQGGANGRIVADNTRAHPLLPTAP